MRRHEKGEVECKYSKKMYAEQISCIAHREIKVFLSNFALIFGSVKCSRIVDMTVAGI